MRQAIQYVDMATVLPDGEHGTARLSAVAIDADFVKLERLRAAMSFNYGEVRNLKPGTYARLYVNRELVMSDTPMERDTCAIAIEAARGHVLIGGLGLGMVLIPMLRKPEVASVTVIERNEDVIALVLKPLVAWMRANGLEPDKRLLVIQGDVKEIGKAWCKEEGGWDVIWMDIWPDICADNWDDMKMLRRKFRPHVRPGGWLGMWREDDVKRLARECRAWDRRQW